MIMEWGMSDRLGPMIFGEHQEQIFLGKQLGLKETTAKP